ncbi:MAG: NAD(P)H-dependent flavin oxidoreductase [bacterium]
MELIIADKFFRKGNEFLNTTYPIICGAMTWISDPKLVAAVSNAGGFACLAGGNTPLEVLKQQIEQTKNLTSRPFGVNLITIAPLYSQQLDLITDLNLDYVIFAGSFPKKKEVQLARDSGAKVMCFASTESIARRMIDYGANALILEGMEAGGHVGQVSLTILLQQVLFEIPEIPIFVAGGIATGKMGAHLLLMGAAGIQLATIFAAAEESCAHPEFKKKLIKSNARDAVSTPQFDSNLPVVAVRALKNQATEQFGKLQLKLLAELDQGNISRSEAQNKVEEFWMGALRRAVQEGDVAQGSLMAGQSVGLVKEIAPINLIMKRLIRDIDQELITVKKLFDG